MTNDAITEARRLLDTWYGLTTTHEEFLARAQTDLAALLSATGAAEARITALQQERDEARDEAVHQNDLLKGAEAERDALQAQLTAARPYMQHADDCNAVVWQGNGWRTPTPTGQPCTCGLAAALPPTPEETQGTSVNVSTP